jgi:hypothetical protein
MFYTYTLAPKASIFTKYNTIIMLRTLLHSSILQLYYISLYYIELYFLIFSHRVRRVRSPFISHHLRRRENRITT